MAPGACVPDHGTAGSGGVCEVHRDRPSLGVECETAERMHIHNGPMLNPFTQQQIAEITGQTSVNVNRVLADMERQGLITRKGREIQFMDWDEMRRVASFQPNYLHI